MGRSIRALKGLPGWPLRLSDEQAAAYVGLTLAQFKQGIATGELPRGKALVGEILWARPELDRCLDASPAAVAGMPDTDPLFDPIADAIERMRDHKC
jgi:hypothetical protein